MFFKAICNLILLELRARLGKKANKYLVLKTSLFCPYIFINKIRSFPSKVTSKAKFPLSFVHGILTARHNLHFVHAASTSCPQHVGELFVSNGGLKGNRSDSSI